MSQEYKFANRFGRVFKYTRERVKLNQLKPGDQIVYERLYSFWHHMIVESINETTKEINVIHYYFNKDTSTQIRRDSFHITQYSFYCILYPEDVECSPPSEILSRATSKLGESKYNLFSNNCEHFATECKTGKSECCQSGPIVEIAMKGRSVGAFTPSHWPEVEKFFLHVYEKATKTTWSYLKPVLQNGREYIGENIWKVFVKKCSTIGVRPSVANLVAKMGSVVDKVLTQFIWLGKTGFRGCTKFTEAISSFCSSFILAFLYACTVEMILTYDDICKAYDKKEAGVISLAEYRKWAAKRVTSAICSIPTSIAGASLGQAIIPIPVIGGMVGGSIGDFMGKIIGGFIGDVYGLFFNF